MVRVSCRKDGKVDQVEKARNKTFPCFFFSLPLRPSTSLPSVFFENFCEYFFEILKYFIRKGFCFLFNKPLIISLIVFVVDDMLSVDDLERKRSRTSICETK